MARRSRGFVDYEAVAALYREGRSLLPEVLDRWERAISPLLPPAPSCILDLGAGTGVFAGAWAEWTGTTVVAVEPAAAMAEQAAAAHADAVILRGVAEALPLRTGTVDVAWLSTTLHHFADVQRAAEELARVLRPGGRLLIRTYVPGRTEVTYMDAFPGRAKWEVRFHTEDELRALFETHGFELYDISEVLEWTESFAQSADWAERMRHADSTFTALTDDEMAQGLEALRAQPERVGRLELTLAVFERVTS